MSSFVEMAVLLAGGAAVAIMGTSIGVLAVAAFSYIVN